MDIRLISNTVSELGESPVYSHRSEEVVWTDIIGKKWIRHNLNSGTTKIQESRGMIGAIAVRKNSGYIVAVEEGFATLEENETYVVTNQILDKNQRMNDGKCDAKGRFWAGSLDLNFKKAKGKLFKLDTNFKSELMLSDLTLPNGLDWSPDNEYFYLIDSLEYELWRFDFDLENGLITNKKIFYKFNSYEGTPDGICVSSCGHILVALYEGSAIHIISPEGTLTRIIELPVKNPTSCIFMGQNLEHLVITSAQDKSEDPQENLAGKTFLLSGVGLTGKKLYSFGG
jgi:sugar lactone lactonase YvrE